MTLEVSLNLDIEKIIRTRRKTIALQVTSEGELIVRAPLKISNETIMSVVLKHRKWIEEKKKEALLKKEKNPPKKFVSGEEFLYLGKPYKLKIVENQREPLKFDNGFFLSEYYTSVAKEIFTGWYREKARKKLHERVEFYASRNMFKYYSIRITSAKKTWGSCSAKGNLNFTWRLIMAPLEVLDYVVVHELAHLEIKNHSKIFWTKVRSMMPDFENHREWLKENGYLLNLF